MAILGSPLSQRLASGRVARHPVAPRAWQSWYVPAAVVLDALTAGLGFVMALALLQPVDTRILHLVELVVFSAPWTALVALNHGYDARLLGDGPDEFRIMMRTGIAALALGGVAGLMVGYIDGGRRVMIAIALAALLDAVARYALRQFLHRRRAAGRSISGCSRSAAPMAPRSSSTSSAETPRTASASSACACRPTATDGSRRWTESRSRAGSTT